MSARLLLAALLVLLGAEARAAECELCPTSEALFGLWSNASSSHEDYISHWSCSFARILSCREDIKGNPTESCWIEHIVEIIVESMGTIASILPSLLLCGKSTCDDTTLGGPFAMIMIAAVLLTLAVRAGAIFFSREPPLAIVPFLVTVAIVFTIIIALGTGTNDWIWRTIGVIATFGVGIGTEIRDIAAQGIHAGNTEISVAHIAGCAELSPKYTETALGWPTLILLLGKLARDILDLSAILFGLAIGFIPDLGNLFSLIGKVSIDMLTLNWSVLGELFRIVIVCIMGVLAIQVAVRYLLVLVEGVVNLGLSVALSPIAVWLWIWRSTQGAMRFVGTEILYASMLFAIAGLVLVIARIIVTIGTRIFLLTSLNEQYTGDLDKIDGAREAGCMTLAEVEASALDLYADFNAQICALSTAPQEGPDDTQIYATHLLGTAETGTGNWLPGAIALLTCAAITSAVLGFARSAAAELSGRTISGGVGEVVGQKIEQGGAWMKQKAGLGA